MTSHSSAPKNTSPPQPINNADWPWSLAAYIKPAVPDNVRLPKISIITPSYNQGRYIEETIRSVLLQGYPNLEYIIIDGGSTDDTLKVIKKYEPWLAHWESVPDHGQSHAINKGMLIATGEIVAWINSDDIYFPGAFFYVAKEYLESRAPWIVGITSIVDESLNKINYFIPNINNGTWRSRNYQSMGWLDFVLTKWSGTALPQPSSFWKRDLFLQVDGLREDFQYAMDHDLTGRMAFEGARPEIIPQVLAGFRVHGQQKTSNPLSFFWDEEVYSSQQFIQPDISNEQRASLISYKKWLTKKISLPYRVFIQPWLDYSSTAVKILKILFQRTKSKFTRETRTKILIKRYLPDNAVIVEAGAHVGADTIEFAGLFPSGTIYAFEPVPAIFFSLARNVGHIQNVRCFPAALGEKDDEVKMFVSSGTSDGSSSLLAPKDHLVDHPDVLFTKTISVTSITLDTWAVLFDIPKIDLLWLDLQGFELGVLKSGQRILETVKAIFTEVNLKETYDGAVLYDDLRDWLDKQGFSLVLEQIYWEDGGNVLFVRKGLLK